MPNPNDPEQAECRWCHDTGEIGYRPCHHCRPADAEAERRIERVDTYLNALAEEEPDEYPHDGGLRADDGSAQRYFTENAL